MTDYYAELQVNPSAEQEVVEKAYKALIFKYHPDRGGDEEKAKRLTAAYYVLSDPGRRAEYDAQRAEDAYRHSARDVSQHTAPQKPTSGSHAYVNIEDIPPEVIDAILARVWLDGAGATVRTAARVAGAVAFGGGAAIGEAIGGLFEGRSGDGLSKVERARLNEAKSDTQFWKLPISQSAVREYARLLDRELPPQLAQNLSIDDLAWLATRHPRANVRRAAYVQGIAQTGAVALVAPDWLRPSIPIGGTKGLRKGVLIEGSKGHLNEAKYSSGSRVMVERALFMDATELHRVERRANWPLVLIAAVLGVYAIDWIVGLVS